MIDIQTTDFLSVALAAHKRGFDVTVLRNKKPLRAGWQRHPFKTETEIRQAAKDYPHLDVGIVMRNGVDNPCCLDIDAAGTIERIERETGHKLDPNYTYSVQSRPKTAEHKRHYFFWQTPYS